MQGEKARKKLEEYFKNAEVKKLFNELDLFEKSYAGKLNVQVSDKTI